MPTTDQTIQEIYRYVVDTLSLSERLHLAALILNDLTQQNITVIDSSDTWSESDQLELTTFSLQYAASLFPESEERDWKGVCGCVKVAIAQLDDPAPSPDTSS